jgi:hypothetical protein
MRSFIESLFKPQIDALKAAWPSHGTDMEQLDQRI